MQLSPHFSLEEFCHSDTAVRHGITNDLPIELRPHAIQTAAMLERIRGAIGLPIIITSGYRSVPVNALVGGKPTSDHVQALAADIRAQGMSPTTLALVLHKRVDELDIGQLILEYPDRNGWVHVSAPLAKPKLFANRVLTITGAGTRQGIVA